MTGDGWGAGRDGTPGLKRDASGAPSAVHTKPHAQPTNSINSLIHSSDTLPVNLPNSSSISSLPLDLGMLPTKSRRFGTLILILRVFPGFISWLSSCGKNNKGKILKKISIRIRSAESSSIGAGASRRPDGDEFGSTMRARGPGSSIGRWRLEPIWWVNCTLMISQSVDGAKRRAWDILNSQLENFSKPIKLTL